MNKTCGECGDAQIFEDGVYCEKCRKWVGRGSETECVIENGQEQEKESNSSECSDCVSE